MKPNLRLQNTLTAGEVIRYHAAPTVDSQNVAAHSWGVAVIVLYLTSSYCSGSLLAEALLHDAAELYTGDIPFTTKRDSPRMKAASVALEGKARSDFLLVPHVTTLNAQEQAILKVADTLEGLLWCTAHEAVGGPVQIRWYEAYNRARAKFNLPPAMWVRANELVANRRQLLLQSRQVIP